MVPLNWNNSAKTPKLYQVKAKLILVVIKWEWACTQLTAPIRNSTLNHLPKPITNWTFNIEKKIQIILLLLFLRPFWRKHHFLFFRFWLNRSEHRRASRAISLDKGKPNRLAACGHRIPSSWAPPRPPPRADVAGTRRSRIPCMSPRSLASGRTTSTAARTGRTAQRAAPVGTTPAGCSRGRGTAGTRDASRSLRRASGARFALPLCAASTCNGAWLCSCPRERAALCMGSTQPGKDSCRGTSAPDGFPCRLHRCCRTQYPDPSKSV